MGPANSESEKRGKKKEKRKEKDHFLSYLLCVPLIGIFLLGYEGTIVAMLTEVVDGDGSGTPRVKKKQKDEDIQSPRIMGYWRCKNNMKG